MTSKSLLTTLTLLLVCTANAWAQQPERPAPPPGAGQGRPNEQNRQGALRRLGLTPEQSDKIRTINREKRPALEAANQKLREANRLLDEAVYSEVSDPASVNARIADAQKAQAEVTRLRALLEFEIRSVLTNEQLGSFRRMRMRRDQGSPNRRGPGMMNPGMQNRPRRPGDANQGPPPRRI